MLTGAQPEENSFSFAVGALYKKCVETIEIVMN